jgi:hypothetical protein
MSKQTNFLWTTEEAPPTDERVWYPTPRIKLFTDTDEAALETQINDWLDALALPVDPDLGYTLTHYDYQTSFTNVALVEYTVALGYVRWVPV